MQLMDDMARKGGGGDAKKGLKALNNNEADGVSA